MNFVLRIPCLMAVGNVLLLTGCSGGPDDIPELAPVSGMVMLDDQPLANASVVFEPESGRPSIGTTNEQGMFELRYSSEERGAKIGKHTVRIALLPESASRKSGDIDKDAVARIRKQFQQQNSSGTPAAAAAGAKSEGGQSTLLKRKLLPARYNSESTLTEEVDAAENVFFYALESESKE